MSSTALPDSDSRRANVAAMGRDANDAVWQVLSALASLKLTCVLLLLSMVIVFIGSLAQARQDVWPVVGQYFRTWIAWIDVQDLFPPSMFPGLMDFDFKEKLAVDIWWFGRLHLHHIPFPGGWTIGVLMFMNLGVAHALRFKVRVRGMRLLAGIGVIVAGTLMTAAIIISGNRQVGVESANTLLEPEQIWFLLLGLLGIAAAVAGIMAFSSQRTKLQRSVLLGVGGAMAALLAFYLIGGESVRPDLSAMRILWQLLKGGACSLVLLIGCRMVFDKRGGIVLLHVGVALLMVSELLVAVYGKENHLTLVEGQTSSYMRDIRERELAIIQPEGDDREQVVALPQELLEHKSEAKKTEDKIVTLESLPFDLRVRSYYQNAELRSIMPDDKPVGTTGLGAFALPVPLDPVTGMDDSQDESAVVVDVIDRETGREIESLLVAQSVSEFRSVPIAEKISVDGKDYEFYLRFQRNYRDDKITLVDTNRENYVGTSTPKDYRSTIKINDPESGTEETFTIWMNNPLRYNGENFYQTGHQIVGDSEISTLSVVRNTGWMLPYIACMIVAFGMFGQFQITLFRYLGRAGRSPATAAAGTVLLTKDDLVSDDASNPFESTVAPGSPPATKLESADGPKWSVIVPVVVVLLCASWLVSKAFTPKANPDSFNLYQFANTPVAWRGRSQPIDTFARAQLLKASHKSTFYGELEQAELNEIRDDLVLSVKKYWPEVNADSLKNFSGQYSDWINEIVRITQSGRDAVEARMRDEMIAKMPAIRWLLDVVARSELAARHRVVKIDNDRVLSLLGLEKRAGMVYSLAEIQPNLQELDTIHRQARSLQTANQSARMDDLQRGVVKLFDTVRSINDAEAAFQREVSTDLVDAITRAQFLFERLEGFSMITATPTGLEDAQRSWETFIAAQAVENVAEEMRTLSLRTETEVKDYVQKSLPRQMVETALQGTHRMVEGWVQEELKEGEEPEADAVKRIAVRAAMAQEDPFLRMILAHIALAEPGTSADDILKNLTDKQISDIAAPRMGATVKAVEDLSKRAGKLLFDDERRRFFVEATTGLEQVLNAWEDNDVSKFNESVAGYQAFLQEQQPAHLHAASVKREAYFNYYEPFWKAIYLYLPVILLSFFSWLVWPKTLRRTAFWMMFLAFVVHTAALGVRMWISGRPPVTSLYSSAIFIGWAVVLAAFVIEKVVGQGIGNILGATCGAATLVIAHYLAIEEGDTMGVMQAVLDTTFWLATHVVCITLGYAATFLAGAIGMAYVAMSLFRADDASKTADLKRTGAVMYGVLCFAVFFSLVGTVLGGLWADDSWGRFWGWDPKENGAMLIVLWNAVILHARWDKMIRDYGTAVLAMVGNIVTAWSWFGVNELGAGLHSYGFTSGRLLALIVFVAVQAVVVLAAAMLGTGRSASKRAEVIGS